MLFILISYIYLLLKFRLLHFQKTFFTAMLLITFICKMQILTYNYEISLKSSLQNFNCQNGGRQKWKKVGKFPHVAPQIITQSNKAIFYLHLASFRNLPTECGYCQLDFFSFLGKFCRTLIFCEY